MFSFILDFIMAVLLIRFIFWLARLFLTSGRMEDGADGRGAAGDGMWGPGNGGSGRSRRQHPIDRSSAVDVPFTEIPPDTDVKETSAHDPHDALQDTPARSAAGDR